MNRWLWSKRDWRTLLIRTALLNGFLLLLALVVAAEFYFTASTGQVTIPWTRGAQLVLRDWVPWLLISPAVVGLAGLFRFERKTWPRSLLAHLVACFVAVFLYECLHTLMFPQPPPGMFGGPLAVPSRNTLSRPTPGPDGSSNLPVSANPDFVSGSPDPRLPISVVTNAASDVSSAPGFSAMAPSAGKKGTDLPFFPMTGFRPGLLQRAAFRTQFVAPIYWCIVCVCWLLNHLQESREREHRALELEARLTEANLRVLKMQLQPHFLFNALNAIASLIHENPKAADDMLGTLSQFLRMNLEAAAENEVALQRELEFVDLYLEIQQARFGDRLRVQRDIDPAVKTAMVPPFILQPLVENSIRHGIETRESGGTVTLRACRRAEMLRLEISDDGAGFKNGDLLKRTEGIGLSNTKARLQALYGERHQFRLTENHPTGACASIEIPFRPLQSGLRGET